MHAETEQSYVRYQEPSDQAFIFNSMNAWPRPKYCSHSPMSHGLCCKKGTRLRKKLCSSIYARQNIAMSFIDLVLLYDFDVADWVRNAINCR